MKNIKKYVSVLVIIQLLCGIMFIPYALASDLLTEPHFNMQEKEEGQELRAEENVTYISAEEPAELMPLAASYCLPDDFLNGGRWTDDWDTISSHLYTYHGLDPNTASSRLHQIKTQNGLPESYNCIFDYTGGYIISMASVLEIY